LDEPVSGRFLDLLVGPFEDLALWNALVASFVLLWQTAHRHAAAHAPESLRVCLSHAVMREHWLLYAASLARFGGCYGLFVAGLARSRHARASAQDVSLIAFYLVSLSFGF